MNWKAVNDGVMIAFWMWIAFSAGRWYERGESISEVAAGSGEKK